MTDEYTGELAGRYFTTDSTGHGTVRLWVSRDHGRHWTRSKLPGAAGDLSVLGGTGSRLFVIVYPDGDGSPYLAASTDGGLTWNRVTVPAGFEKSTNSDDAEAVLPDGGVLATTHGQLWLLPPGSTAFRPVDDGVTTVGLVGLGGAVVATRVIDGHLGVYVTTNGTDWRRSTVTA